ncbi:MAG: hypothetical protein HYR85_08870 [Planctomycetes bacterium]|nr:hypothetical protein [Planctomycetota bacterium]MBI3844768.1 hypothetical protein [Planctomycetota bacterium]
MNPTPLGRIGGPLPLACVRGHVVPAATCRGTHELASPARAPWTLTTPHGLPSGTVLVLQGVLEDAGAANVLGYSVTNAVILAVP